MIQSQERCLDYIPRRVTPSFPSDGPPPVYRGKGTCPGSHVLPEGETQLGRQACLRAVLYIQIILWHAEEERAGVLGVLWTVWIQPWHSHDTLLSPSISLQLWSLPSTRHQKLLPCRGYSCWRSACLAHVKP